MNGESLRALLKGRPFRPFTMGLAGGARIRVTRPDWAIVSPGGKTMIVYETVSGPMNLIDTANVAVVELDPPVPPEVDPAIVVEH